MSKLDNPTHGSGWIAQILSKECDLQPLGNPTHGSGWTVQILSRYGGALTESEWMSAERI